MATGVENGVGTRRDSMHTIRKLIGTEAAKDEYDVINSYPYTLPHITA